MVPTSLIYALSRLVFAPAGEAAPTVVQDPTAEFEPAPEPVAAPDDPDSEPEPEPEFAPNPFRTEVVTGRDDPDGLAAQRALSRRNFGFVSSIDLGAEPGRGPADGLPRVLSRIPGVTVRSIGGLGQFSAVSIRGSTSLQVPVFLDGAPLTGSLSGTVDLGAAPLDALTRVDIYRGHVPARYGAAPIGGAIDLVGRVHRGPPALWFSAGFGSFLAREARAGYATRIDAPGRPGETSLALRLGYAGARGNFSHFDDNGTPLLSADDGYSQRRNNHYDRALAQLRVDHERGALTVSSQLLAWWKLQGIPGLGTGSAPVTDADQRTLALRSITRVRYAAGLGLGGHVEWIASVAVEDRVFRDLLGQVGLSANDQRARGFDGWLSPRLRVPLWSMAWLELSAELRGEWIDIDERYGDDDDGQPDPTALASGDATRTRLSTGLGIELEQWLFERRWALSPALRLDLADSRFAVPDSTGEVDDQGRDRLTLGLSPRLATKITLAPGLQARASVGRYLRFPTLSELFGDRGYMIGNEGLAPERGTKVDGGLTLDLQHLGARENLSVFAQLAGFATWSRDLIQWVRSGPVVQPRNIAGARIRGLEAGLGLRAFGRDLALDLAYTLLDSRNDSPEVEQRGKPLPGRPRHSLLIRPSGGHRFLVGRARSLEPRIHYDLEWIAGNVLDLSGRVELPPRILHGVGVSVRALDRVEIGVEVRNLGDLRRTRITPEFGPQVTYPSALSDFIGYPLPGRSIWATLRLDLAPSRARPRS